MRVIVVGGGIYGQVISWRLALRQVDVVQVEPRGPGNLASGSGDKSRIVRGLYGRSSWAETGARSLPLWESWGSELETELVRLSGVLYLEHASRGSSDDEFRRYLDDGLGFLLRMGRAVEVLSPEELEKRYPAMRATGLVRALYEPGGGIGWASKATRAIARAGERTGRVTHVASEAKRILLGGSDGVRVLVADGAGERTLEGDHVVVAAAQGGVGLVEPLVGRSLGIRPIPHFTSYWDVPWPEGRALSLEELPPWAELGGLLYGFPDDGENGFKVAWHEPLRDEASGDSDASDTWREPPSAAATEALREATSKRFPALARATLRGTYQCRYDATRDENFQVGEVPGAPNVTFVGGMSGHGYKHAPIIGESVAQRIVGEVPLSDLADYAIRLSEHRA